VKAAKLTKETILDLGKSNRTFPEFNVGDRIAVSLRIKEEKVTGKKKEIKERLQVFEGDVIGMHKKGASSSFTMRKIGANSIPVERIFPFDCPTIEKIKFVRAGKVRRAKLNYLKDRVGKAGQIAKKVFTKEQKEQKANAHKGETTQAPTTQE